MDEALSRPEMRDWQRRTFATVWIPYCAYYLCRHNMPVPKTLLWKAKPQHDDPLKGGR